MLGVLGLLTLGIIAVLPAEVLAVESGILKACVGPPLVDPLGVGVARRGDQITCGIEVVNVKPSEGSVCITSTLDLFMGDPASCTDQGCQCVGGSQNTQACSGTAGECPPPWGLNPGTCSLLGRDTGISANLLDVGELRRCVTSAGTVGTDPCTQASDCAPGQPDFERRQVIVSDQFTETQPLSTVRGDCRASSFLCVPSTKHLP